MKPFEKDGYIYSPPAWRVRDKCDGKGRKWNPIIGTCDRCNGTGRIPIYYTPEQWQEAGGILTDDTPCWQIIKQGSETFFFMEPWGNIKETQEGTIIIATEAGRPPRDYQP
jgi:hypothetical protein